MTGPRLETFGCRLNTFESEIMRGHAEKAGLDNSHHFQHLCRDSRGHTASAASHSQGAQGKSGR